MMRFADPRSVKLIIAGPDLKPLGPPVTDWSSLDCTDKLNDAGVGEFVAPARSDLVDMVSSPGARVHLYVGGTVWLAGPIEVPGALDWSTTAGGEITVNWASDKALLGWRITYPNPAAASTAQGTTLRYTATSVNAEVAMRDLVRLNAGPDALTARKITGLVLGTLAGVGTTVSVSTRFDPLPDQLRTIASAGGTLAYDVLLDDSVPQLEFVVRAPQDLSNRVVYSDALSNLTAVKTAPASPTATVAIVGFDASDTTPDTTVVERIDSDGQAWGRMETWVSGTSLDSTATAAEKQAQMEQDGDLALLDAKASAGLDATVFDTADTRYRKAFNLGDTLGVRPDAGQLLADVATAVRLTGTPKDGLVESPTIGTGNPSVSSRRLRAIRDLDRRLGRQERG